MAPRLELASVVRKACKTRRVSPMNRMMTRLVLAMALIASPALADEDYMECR